MIMGGSLNYRLPPEKVSQFAPEKLHPGKLTWNLKITCLKRIISFQTFIFGFHVHFQGCTRFSHPKRKVYHLPSNPSVFVREKLAVKNFRGLRPIGLHQAVEALMLEPGFGYESASWFVIFLVDGVLFPVKGKVGGLECWRNGKWTTNLEMHSFCVEEEESKIL